MESRRYHSLLKCPLGTPVTVTRIADQDTTFLQFLETQGLKPGQSVEVEARDRLRTASASAPAGSAGSSWEPRRRPRC